MCGVGRLSVLALLDREHEKIAALRARLFPRAPARARAL